ncbi:unnamed protein product [Soboliphyme baturini]|uniref:Uncharacterized protein n=1 Tax=Soboliphyme baturini TaxID=241478 RepID=A0A183IVJ2_9BILA|nr:unnamed protein product [Soboliphyme baturini]
MWNRGARSFVSGCIEIRCIRACVCNIQISVSVSFKPTSVDYGFFRATQKCHCRYAGCVGDGRECDSTGAAKISVQGEGQRAGCWTFALGADEAAEQPSVTDHARRDEEKASRGRSEVYVLEKCPTEPEIEYRLRLVSPVHSELSVSPVQTLPKYQKTSDSLERSYSLEKVCSDFGIETPREHSLSRGRSETPVSRKLIILEVSRIMCLSKPVEPKYASSRFSELAAD